VDANFLLLGDFCYTCQISITFLERLVSDMDLVFISSIWRKVFKFPVQSWELALSTILKWMEKWSLESIFRSKTRRSVHHQPFLWCTAGILFLPLNVLWVHHQ